MSAKNHLFKKQAQRKFKKVFLKNQTQYLLENTVLDQTKLIAIKITRFCILPQVTNEMHVLISTYNPFCRFNLCPRLVPCDALMVNISFLKSTSCSERARAHAHTPNSQQNLQIYISFTNQNLFVFLFIHSDVQSRD